MQWHLLRGNSDRLFRCTEYEKYVAAEGVTSHVTLLCTWLHFHCDVGVDVCIMVWRACMCECGNHSYEGLLELADFYAWGNAYRCEVCNGTSHCVLCVHGTCKVQSTQQFVIEFYFMSGCVSCHFVSCHVTSHHAILCWGISKHDTFQCYFAMWSRTCSELLEAQSWTLPNTF
jgi:hypothetical protein